MSTRLVLLPNKTSKNVEKGGLTAATVIAGTAVALIVASNPELAPFAKAATVVGAGVLGFIFGFIKNRWFKKHYKEVEDAPHG